MLRKVALKGHPPLPIPSSDPEGSNRSPRGFAPPHCVWLPRASPSPQGLTQQLVYQEEKLGSVPLRYMPQAASIPGNLPKRREELR